MSMTITEMRTFVRTHADADTEDAPDGSLDVYARIAYNDILSRQFEWPHLAVAYTLTTTASLDAYPFTAFSSTDIDIVSSVNDTTVLGRRLVYVTRSDASKAWPVTATTGLSVAYGVSYETLTLYPTPNAATTYRVTGYRKPAAWPTDAASIPDLPAPLHEAIVWYMLSSYYMSQEDTQMAGVYLQEYEQMVARFTRKETTKEARGRPRIMGGQSSAIGGGWERQVRGVLE